MTGLSDRELIERFSHGRDQTAEAAFEALVSRHGPMVQRVCRNVLANPDDAEDAFQATFLVLVKERGTIRKLDSVASWLYGVASRVAARARVDAARRRKAEGRDIRLAADSVHDEAGGALEDAADGPVIQEEVRRLPEKYRSVVVLCFWEGLSQEQAAHQLGCPLGTVRSRMARARAILSRRFVRRGLAPASGTVGLLLDPAASSAALAQAAVPPGLILSCVQAATRVVAGLAPTEVVSVRVASLVRDVLWSLMMIKIKNVALPLALSGLLVGGASLWAQQSRAVRPKRAPRRPPVSARPESAPKPTPLSDRAALAYVIEPPDLLLVEVLEALPGRPISGERLVRPDGNISLGFYGDVYVAGLKIPQAKEKIVRHLQKFLEDETLGLTIVDPATGEPKKDKDGKPVLIDPKDSDRVFVDVTAYNSKHIYVLGEVTTPGSFPFTGSDRVLDVLFYAGGLLPTADRGKIRLIRSFPKGSPEQVLPVDYEEMTMGTDSSTNYEVRPGDRIVVYRDPKSSSPPSPAPEAESPRISPKSPRERSQLYFDRMPENDTAPVRDSFSKLERRLDEMEKKLDAILMKLVNPAAR
jgi:RNA polymerase sigma factor (sigma-70 family)